MRYGIPSFQIVGYTADATLYCLGCCPYEDGETDREGNQVHPVFAGAEDANDHCMECGRHLLDDL